MWLLYNSRLFGRIASNSQHLTQRACICTSRKTLLHCEPVLCKGKTRPKSNRKAWATLDFSAAHVYLLYWYTVLTYGPSWFLFVSTFGLMNLAWCRTRPCFNTGVLHLSQWITCVQVSTSFVINYIWLWRTKLLTQELRISLPTPLLTPINIYQYNVK